MASGDLVTRIYGGFRGVDFRGEDVNLMRSPDSLNMWKNYKLQECISTRPSMRKIQLFISKDNKELKGKIHGIHNYSDTSGIKQFYIHCNNRIYDAGWDYSGKTSLYLSEYENFEDSTAKPLEMNNAPSMSFVFDDSLYIKDGKNYYKLSKGIFSETVKGYVPTTSIGRKPSGGGTLFEDVNMLTGRRKNSFVGDGKSKEYYLDANGIDSDFTPIVHVNSELLTFNAYYTVDYVNGKIVFKDDAIPSEPGTDGRDNVVVEFKKTIAGEREKIEECTLMQVFDNRVFFSGNKKYPNRVWYSSLDNPEYISDLDYMDEGFDTAAITSMVAGNNALWVMKEPATEYTTIFYHTPTIDAEYGKIYPSVHSNISTGCVGKAINFNDDVVFFSPRGMEGIHGDITSEQVIAHRSSVVDNKLLNEENYNNMLLEEWEGYLLVIIDNKVYLADSRGVYENINHIEYEWFYWELEENITCTKVIDGCLYLGTENGLYILDDNVSSVKSHWTTPKDRFKYPQYMKTTNKRGCVAEASGSYSVSVKTDKSDAFELISSHQDVDDYSVSRIKRKKFKDIQLKFHSDKRFCLESVTLECFIGGYIKR